jgi:hypothetical protein
MAFHPFCWGVQVCEKLVDPSIRENRDSCGRYVKVAEKLACMVDIQWLTELFTFDQHLDLAIFENGIVDLFTFLVPTSQMNSGTTSEGLKTSYPNTD